MSARVERPAARRRGGVPVFLIVLAVGVVGIAGYIGYQIVAERQARSRAEVAFARHDAAIRQWEVAMRIASKTPRLALSGPVRDLASIEASVRDAPADACVAEAAKALVQSMQFPREALMEFMANSVGADLILGSAERMSKMALADYAQKRADCIKSPRY